MKTIILLLSLATCTMGFHNLDFFRLEWNSWKSEHQKNYHPIEEHLRFTIYMDNKARIARHNLKVRSEGTGFFLKMNHLGDMTPDEVASSRNGFAKGLLRNATRLVGATFIAPENAKIPKSVDWRKKGAVTPVKDQGSCGSCWSFSATGALEGQYFRKTGKLVSLSEQNLVDCSTKYGNHGCQGGLMDFAFKYIKDNHGIDTEESYPYEGKEKKCRFSKKNIGATDVGFVDIPEGDEHKLMEAVATMGPISIAIDASLSTFQLYSKGIYDEINCSSKDLDHGVLLVGYGTDHGKDYWLIKNSWGPGWGENGLIKIARNKKNMCGVATMASYPIV